MNPLKQIKQGQCFAEEFRSILELVNTSLPISQAFFKLPPQEQSSLVVRDHKPQNTLFLQTVQITGISIVRQAPDGARKSAAEESLLDFLCGCLGQTKKKSIGTIRRNLQRFIDARSKSKRQRRNASSASTEKSKLNTSASSGKSIFQIGRRPHKIAKITV